MCSRAIQCSLPILLFSNAPYSNIALPVYVRVDVRYLEKKSRYEHVGKLQTTINLIQRHGSTIPAIKILVLIHSACPYKNHALKCCSQFLHELHTKQKKLVQISSYNRARFIALPGLKIRLKCSHVHSRAIQYKHTPTVLFEQIG